jgi:hypothetical protein
MSYKSTKNGSTQVARVYWLQGIEAAKELRSHRPPDGSAPARFTTVMDLSMRTQRAGRLSPGTTRRSGP